MGDEVCERCFEPVPVWSAPDDQWNAVTEHPGSGIRNGRGAVLCVPCFLALAEQLYGRQMTLRVELQQAFCSRHSYWPPCPDGCSWDPCQLEMRRAGFGRRLEHAQEESRWRTKSE